MTEQRHALRVNSLSLVDINLALAQLADRLDEMQGLRGTPQFHNHPNLGGNRLQNVGQATGGAQALTYDTDGSILVSNNLVRVNVGSGLVVGPDGVSVNTRDAIYVPSTATMVAGTSASAVEAMQTAFDGTVYTVSEVAATPGFNLEMRFAGVASWDTISGRIRYDGLSTHYVTLEMYSYLAQSWQQLGLVWHSSAYYHWYTWSGIPNSEHYIDGGASILRLYHNTAGNAAHRLYVDYIQLSQGQEVV